MYAQMAWQGERMHKKESFILIECCVDQMQVILQMNVPGNTGSTILFTMQRKQEDTVLGCVGGLVIWTLGSGGTLQISQIS